MRASRSRSTLRSTCYRGRLIDEATEKPVGDALVQDLFHPAVQARTDARGDFALQVHPVSFLHVVPTEHRRGVLGPQADGLRKRAASETFRLERGQKLSALLLDGDGEPLRGARVVFAGPGSNLRENRITATATWEDRTADDGRIIAHWHEPGLPIAGFVEVGDQLVWFLLRAPDRPLDLGSVRVSATAYIDGKVDAPDRTPLSGAHVYLQPQLPPAEAEALLDTPPGFFSRITCTDRGGRFRFDGLRAGTYEIAVDAPGRGRRFTTAKAGLPPPPLRVTLAAGEVLRGEVVDGRPVGGAGVTVTLHRPPADWRLAAWRFDLIDYRTTTDAAGLFAIAGLPADAVCTVAVRRDPGAELADSVTEGVSAVKGPLRIDLGNRR